jgi:hypothetical protein
MISICFDLQKGQIKTVFSSISGLIWYFLHWEFLQRKSYFPSTKLVFCISFFIQTGQHSLDLCERGFLNKETEQ